MTEYFYGVLDSVVMVVIIVCLVIFSDQLLVLHWVTIVMSLMAGLAIIGLQLRRIINQRL